MKFRDIIHRFKQPKKVLILSYGNAGAKWLAQTLHKLNHVFCTVGQDHPLESMNYWHNKDEFEQLLTLVREGHFRKYGCRNHLLANRYHLTLPDRISDHWNIILDETDEVSRYFRPNRKYLINVHGLNVASYLISKYAKDKSIQVYDLIRHPITMADSHIRGAITSWNNDIQARAELIQRIKNNLPLLATLTSKHKIDFSDVTNLMSFLAFHHIAGISYSLQELSCPRITFEELRTNPDYFSHFYHSLFGEKPTSDYLDFVYSKENMISGRITGNENSSQLEAEAQYAAWTDAQRQIFKDIVRTDLQKIYQPYGYDFSFTR